MKSKFMLLVLLLVITQLAMAQNESKVAAALRDVNNDTAKYIQERILDHKSAYLGKPLDSLLRDLPAILTYTNGDVPRDRSICPYTTLFFAPDKEVMDRLERKEFAQLITITWATPLNNNEIKTLGSAVWGGYWNQTAYNYYKDKIIGDITY